MFGVLKNRCGFVKRVAVIGSTLVFGLTAGHVNAGKFEDTHKIFIDQHVYPLTDQFKNATIQFKKSIEALCRSSTTERSEFMAPFMDLNESWQQIQHIRLGALTDYDQFHRIAFWPDKRGKLSKALRGLEAEIEAGKQPDLQHLASGSVAVQGLPLLERLIFAKDDPVSKNECDYIYLVAENLDEIGHSIVRGWQNPENGYGAEILLLTGEPELYTSELGAQVDILTNFLAALEWVEDIKIRAALGETPQDARYKRLENWRSNLSFRNIRLNMQSLRLHYEQVYQPFVKAFDYGDVKDKKILERFDKVDSILANRGTVDVMKISLPDVWEDMMEVAKTIRSIRSEIFVTGRKLEIPVGFNSLDGD